MSRKTLSISAPAGLRVVQFDLPLPVAIFAAGLVISAAGFLAGALCAPFFSMVLQ